MDLKEAQQRSAELEQWLGKGLHGAKIPTTDNVMLACALFDLVQEHHRAISQLLESGQHGSAFTLLRPAFETLVRGTWLARAAQADGVAAFQADRPPAMEVQLNALRQTEFGPWFSDVRVFAWSAMCSYAHGGQFHAVRRIGDGAIEPGYEPEAQVQVLRLAGFLSLLAALQVASIGQLGLFAKEVSARVLTWYDDITGKVMDPAGAVADGGG
ncbi:MAG: hypothetical protein AMXMBFR59_16660 [Rhodanobacteraceae bacterium]